MKILILTAKFGMGHYSASHSIEQQIQQKFPNASISIVDFFEYSAPRVSNILYKSFNLLINRASTCYNFFYRLSEKGEINQKPILVDYFSRSLQQLINELNPTLIISTVPFCSQLLSHYDKKSKKRIPFVTCITDVSSHCEWINENTTYYLVASLSIKMDLINKGVHASQIQVIGIPVKREFNEPIESSFKNSHSYEKKLLIMGGGLGLLPKSESFYEALNQLNHVKTTVITGKNKRLFNLLHNKYQNIEVIGFTDQVYKFMQEADLMISKPGGITVFEAINSEIPLLVFEPFLQQEVNNANFISLHCLGHVIQKKQTDYIEMVSNLIYDAKALDEIKRNMQQLKKQFDKNALKEIILSVQLVAYAS